MHSLGMAVTLILKSWPQSPKQYQRHSPCREAQPAHSFQLMGRDLWWLRKLDHQDTACPYNYQVVSKGTARKPCSSIYLPTSQDQGKENRAEREASDMSPTSITLVDSAIRATYGFKTS